MFLRFRTEYESTNEIASGEFRCPYCNSRATFTYNRVTKTQVNVILFIPSVAPRLSVSTCNAQPATLVWSPVSSLILVLLLKYLPQFLR